MHEVLALPTPANAACLALATRAITWITPRVRAALPGTMDAIRSLHRQGYQLHTASGAHSLELTGYLEGMGVRDCFGRLYAADLINTFKNGPAFYQRLFADVGLLPMEALVVDDSPDALTWAAETGARTVLVNPSDHPGMNPISCIRSLADLPAFLDQRG